MPNDDLARDVQAEAQATQTLVLMDPVETIEHVTHKLGRDADAVVMNGERYAAAVAAEPDRDHPTVRAVFRRVVEQISDDLLPAERIDLGTDRRIDLHVPAVPFGVAEACGFDGLRRQGGQVGRAALDVEPTALNVRRV